MKERACNDAKLHDFAVQDGSQALDYKCSKCGTGGAKLCYGRGTGGAKLCYGRGMGVECQAGQSRSQCPQTPQLRQAHCIGFVQL